MGLMGPWAMGMAAAWLHGHSLVVWLIEDNGSGAVERPARWSMMPPTVACISCSSVLLVLYPYLDPMDGQMPDSHTYTVYSLTRSAFLSGQTSLNHRH